MLVTRMKSVSADIESIYSLLKSNS